MSLYKDLDDAKSIVQGGSPNDPKARRFIATTIDRAMRRIVDAELLASHVMQARHAEKSAKKILSALRKKV